MKEPAIEQRLQHDRYAADAIEVERDVIATGFEVGDIRRAGENFADVMQVECDAAFMGDGG